ncbi:hypothetical protein, partial [Escherichia coli]|uniref:hypothetical protein n=1 Tax=Escherichia coli TaxID=562 RepID=UPI003F5214CB
SNNNCKNIHLTTEEIIEDFTIPLSKKDDCIFHSYYENRIPSEQIKTYLLNCKDKNSTSYRRLLCLYDYINYSI